MADPADFLSRWSRRKVLVREGKAPPPEPVAPPAPAVPAAATPALPAVPAEPLPPVETLTHDSDFTAYLQPGVDPDVKRQAMHLLLRDPRFNVMDGLDIYTGDYSQPDPLPAGWLEQLNQVARLGAYEEKPAPESAGDNAEELADAIPAAPGDPQAPGTDSGTPSVTPDAGDEPPEVRQ